MSGCVQIYDVIFIRYKGILVYKRGLSFCFRHRKCHDLYSKFWQFWGTMHLMVRMMMMVTLIFVEMNLWRRRRRQVCKFLLSPYFTLATLPTPPNLTKIKTHRRGGLGTVCSGVPAGVQALCGDKYSGKLRDKASAALHAENLFLGIQLHCSLLCRNTVEKYNGEI